MNDELTCNQADLLLAGYAIDSLVEEERCSFLAHLAECRLHDEELAGYRAVTSKLPVVIDPVAPPSQLRSNLLRNFDAMSNAPAESEPLPSTPPKRNILGLLRTPNFAYGIAAALLVAVVALAAVAVSGRSTTAGERVTQVANSAAIGKLNLTYLPAKQVGILNLDLPALPSGRIYQAWQITGSGPVSLGTVSNSGPTAFSADLSATSAIAVSIEPTGGSPQPTTTPLLVTKL